MHRHYESRGPGFDSQRVSDFLFIPLRPFFYAALAKRWKVQFRKGLRKFTTLIQKRHIWRHQYFWQDARINDLASGHPFVLHNHINYASWKFLLFFVFVRKIILLNNQLISSFYFLVSQLVETYFAHNFYFAFIHNEWYMGRRTPFFQFHLSVKIYLVEQI